MELCLTEHAKATDRGSSAIEVSARSVPERSGSDGLEYGFSGIVLKSLLNTTHRGSSVTEDAEVSLISASRLQWLSASTC